MLKAGVTQMRRVTGMKFCDAQKHSLFTNGVGHSIGRRWNGRWLGVSTALGCLPSSSSYREGAGQRHILLVRLCRSDHRCCLCSLLSAWHVMHSSGFQGIAHVCHNFGNRACGVHRNNSGIYVWRGPATEVTDRVSHVDVLQITVTLNDGVLT